MNESAQPARLPEAPGASASRACGLVAILSGFLLGPFCIGIPIAIVMGTVAIVKANKAKRLAADHPGDYAPSTATGLVMGIVGVAMPVLMLPIIGIMSAIAIPALLSQRARARDKAAIQNLSGGLGELAAQYDRLREGRSSEKDLKAGLEAHLRSHFGNDRNPWNPNQPSFSYTIEVVRDLTAETRAETLVARPTDVGQGVFLIQFPAKGQQGFLAGYTKLNGNVRGSNLWFQETPVD